LSGGLLLVEGGRRGERRGLSALPPVAAGPPAALYLARARYRVLVVEKDHFGGQITITNEVVNYPGVFSTSGSELSETMRKQAEAFGAEFLLAEVTDLDMSGDVKVVHTTKGERPCLSVLLASGAHPRHIGFVGEEDYQGHGVAYCATCDGEFFTGKEVFVGDIIKCTRGCLHEVYLEKEYGGTYIGGMPAIYLKGIREGYAWTGDEVIIGNVYQNPELLEVTE